MKQIVQPTPRCNSNSLHCNCGNSRERAFTSYRSRRCFRAARAAHSWCHSQKRNTLRRITAHRQCRTGQGGRRENAGFYGRFVSSQTRFPSQRERQREYPFHDFLSQFAHRFTHSYSLALRSGVRTQRHHE